MSDIAIEFRSVSKGYGDFLAVNDVSFQIERGEFVALLGPSGCGKSTILKLIAGVEDPTSGEIYVDQELVNYTPAGDRNVAMVFQNYALYPHMSVSKNIGYPLTTRRGRRPSSGILQNAVNEAASIVEINDQLEKFPEALSGGQRQRVALARAIIRDPSVFLMDEPLSNLDALLRDSMRRQLIALHRRVGKATVYVTHDQLEAVTMADRIVVLSDGAIQQVGSPREVFEQPANLFVAGFVGSPAMNLVAGQVAGRRQLRIGNAVLTVAADLPDLGSNLTIGLRPTDFQLRDHSGENHGIPGSIVGVEYTGADHLIDFQINGGSLIRIRDTGHGVPEVGMHRVAEIPAHKLHIFLPDGQRHG